jgi:hypothetical protein
MPTVIVVFNIGVRAETRNHRQHPEVTVAVSFQVPKALHLIRLLFLTAKDGGEPQGFTVNHCSKWLHLSPSTMGLLLFM